jgi:hypothetical protein
MIFSCASLSNYVRLPFNQQTLRPNPDKPGEFIYTDFDMQNPYKCGFLKLSKCYPVITTRYESSDVVTWAKIVSAQFVLKAREIPK